MTYLVSFKPSFFKDLERLPPEIRGRIVLMIEQIKRDPFAVAAKRLSGQKQLYRYRYGDYRLIYYVGQKEHKTLFLFVGHRKEIYRSLK